jgi:hypothetical protein
MTTSTMSNAAMLVTAVCLFSVCGLHAQTSIERSVIPLVLAGSEVTILNDDPNVNGIDVKFSGGGQIRITLQPRAMVRLTSPSAGYVLIESRVQVTAYSVVQGAVFTNVQLNTYVRLFVADSQTGIAIVNPWSSGCSLTLWLYDESGEAAYFRHVLKPGEIRSQMFSDWAPRHGEYTILVASILPVAIGVARQDGDRFMAVPVKAAGVQTIGPVNDEPKQKSKP